MSKTKAELEARVAELEARIEELEAQPEPKAAEPEQSGPRDVAEISRELRGES